MKICGIQHLSAELLSFPYSYIELTEGVKCEAGSLKNSDTISVKSPCVLQDEPKN